MLDDAIEALKTSSEPFRPKKHIPLRLPTLSPWIKRLGSHLLIIPTLSSCRNQIAEHVLDDAIEALKTSVDIVVFDAANSTQQRRKWISEKVQAADLYAQVSILCGGGLSMQHLVKDDRHIYMQAYRILDHMVVLRILSHEG
jgi:hypothetical protein